MISSHFSPVSYLVYKLCHICMTVMSISFSITRKLYITLLYNFNLSLKNIEDDIEFKEHTIVHT